MITTSTVPMTETTRIHGTNNPETMSRETETEVSEAYTTSDSTTPSTFNTTTPGQEDDKVIIYVLGAIGGLLLVIVIISIVVAQRRGSCSRNNRRQPSVLQHPENIDRSMRNVGGETTALEILPTDDDQQEGMARPRDAGMQSPAMPSQDKTEHAPAMQYKRDEEQTCEDVDCQDMSGKLETGAPPTSSKEAKYKAMTSESLPGLNKLALVDNDPITPSEYRAAPTQKPGKDDRNTVIYENIGNRRLQHFPVPAPNDGNIGNDQAKISRLTYQNIDVFQALRLNCSPAEAGHCNAEVGITVVDGEIYDNNEAARSAVAEDIYDNNEAARSAMAEDIYDNNEAARSAMPEDIYDNNEFARSAMAEDIYDNNEAARSAMPEDIYDNSEFARSAMAENICDNNEAARPSMNQQYSDSANSGQVDSSAQNQWPDNSKRHTLLPPNAGDWIV